MGNAWETCFAKCLVGASVRISFSCGGGLLCMGIFLSCTPLFLGNAPPPPNGSQRQFPGSYTALPLWLYLAVSFCALDPLLEVRRKIGIKSKKILTMFKEKKLD